MCAVEFLLFKSSNYSVVTSDFSILCTGLYVCCGVLTVEWSQGGCEG